MTSKNIFIASLCLIIFGTRLMLIGIYGNATPFWDEWDAIGNALIAPLMRNNFDYSALFVAHNEHRILLTRLSSLALFFINGEKWYTLVEMCLCAMLYGLFSYIVISGTSPEKRTTLITQACVSVTIMLIPFGTENLLSGFQTAFYFSAFFSVILLFEATRDEPAPGHFSRLVIYSVLAFSSLAGSVASMAIALAIFVARLSQRSQPNWHMKAGAFLLLIIAALWLTPTVAAHSGLRAKSASQFMSAFVELAAWPMVPVLAWVPFLLFFVWVKTPRDRFNERCWFISALFAWSIVQIALIAYSRAEAITAPRYRDLFIPGLIAQIAMLFDIFAAQRNHFLKALVSAPILIIILFCALRAPIAFKEINRKQEHSNSEEYNVVYFLKNGTFNTSSLLPFPDENYLKNLLSDTAFIKVLPAVRKDGAYGFEQGDQRSIVRWSGMAAIFAGFFALATLACGLMYRRAD